MKKVILYSALSLDNFIAGPNGEIDWLFEDGDYGYYDFYDSIDTTLMGNTTYQLVLTFGEFPYPDKANYVFTRDETLEDTQYVKFVTKDIVPLVSALKEQPGKDIFLIGGGQINTILLNAGLIDEMVLSYHPIVLGEGIPLFAPGAQRMNFVTQKCQQFESGLFQVTLTRS